MEEKIVKLGLIGCGRGRAIVGETIGQKSVIVTAVCDIVEKRVNDAVNFFKERGVEVKGYLDFEEMLREADIDAVVVATEAVKHVPIVTKVLEAGKHVLSEIPTVNSIEEAKELKAAVKAHPELKYMAGENCCYLAFIEMWKKMYEDGKFGDIAYAESEYLHCSSYVPDYKYSPGKDHWRRWNPAIKYLTHNLGPLLYVLNDKVVSVSCMTPDVTRHPDVLTCKNGVALFKTAKGTVIRILIAFNACVGFDHNFSLIGTKGSIQTDKNTPWDEAHCFARFFDIPGATERMIEIPVSTKFDGDPDSGHGGADRKMIMDFVRCIIEDTDSPIDVDLGIQMSLPGIIADMSSQQGGAVLEIPEI